MSKRRRGCWCCIRVVKDFHVSACFGVFWYMTHELKQQEANKSDGRAANASKYISQFGTGRRRLIGCLKLQVTSCKRATNYRALLRKMTDEDKTSYGSSPLCIYMSKKRKRCWILFVVVLWLCIFLYLTHELKQQAADVSEGDEVNAMFQMLYMNNSEGWVIWMCDMDESCPKSSSSNILYILYINIHVIWLIFTLDSCNKI